MENKELPKIISIVGLTASGKSGVGIELALKYNGEIVSADSRQIYKGIDIGSGKVTKQEQAMVPHHLLDIVEVGTRFDVATYQKLAYEKIDEILSRGKLPIIVGGTGLYSRSVVDGYNFDRGKNNAKYNVLQMCLMPSKDVVLQNVKKRTGQRLREGLVEETKLFLQHEEWLNKLGFEYSLTVQLIKGEITNDEFMEWFIIRSQQFAKRQRTWFKKEKNTLFLTEPKTYIADCEKAIDKFIKQE